MLIQNINGVTPVTGFTSNTSGPVPATTPGTQNVSATPPQATPNPQKTIQPTDAQLKSAVDSINNTMKQNNSNVEFSIEKGSDQAVIKVVDTQTGQLISQFPSKSAVAISQMVAQSQPGALVKQEA
jgi:flagellar protein FlaG